MREGFCERRSAKRRRELSGYRYTSIQEGSTSTKARAWAWAWAWAWETLLTKRIHPTQHFDSGIIEIRPSVGDLANGA
ncbi:MAG: hypothetical protein EOS08_23010 [Mesorhizobium sp.]|nr:MAG: hypothetical protein EOS08_23010 [Mesorhizobium sp.]